MEYYLRVTVFSGDSLLLVLLSGSLSEVNAQHLHSPLENSSLHSQAERQADRVDTKQLQAMKLRGCYAFYISGNGSRDCYEVRSVCEVSSVIW